MLKVWLKAILTIVWPNAILTPERKPPLLPYIRLAKKRGPGDRTPDAESKTTSAVNSIIIIHPNKVHNIEYLGYPFIFFSFGSETNQMWDCFNIRHCQADISICKK